MRLSEMAVVTDSAIVNHVGTSLQDFWNSLENLLVDEQMQEHLSSFISYILKMML